MFRMILLDLADFRITERPSGVREVPCPGALRPMTGSSNALVGLLSLAGDTPDP